MAPPLPLNPTYNPSDVMLSKGAGPYMNIGPTSTMRKVNEGSMKQASNPAPPTKTLGAESVRAAGGGPFDSAYRQNLATFAGGQFSRPSGSMNFNPTDPSTFPGQPTGGGNAPIAGLPSSLLDMAMGGQGFSWTPPATDNGASGTVGSGSAKPNVLNLQDWIKQFLMQGRNQGRMMQSV